MYLWNTHTIIQIITSNKQDVGSRLYLYTTSTFSRVWQYHRAREKVSL